MICQTEANGRINAILKFPIGQHRATVEQGPLDRGHHDSVHDRRVLVREDHRGVDRYDSLGAKTARARGHHLDDLIERHDAVQLEGRSRPLCLTRLPEPLP